MLSIVEVPEESTDTPESPATGEATLTESARQLFTAYGAFVDQVETSGYFQHDLFLHELATLPRAYTRHDGAVLVALTSPDASDPALPNPALPTPAGCIAFRANPAAGPGTAEIKRLYVSPGQRGQGIARALVTAALAGIRARGFHRAILDTDVAHMPGAHELYLGFGFHEYGTRKGSITFFELTL